MNVLFQQQDLFGLRKECPPPMLAISFRQPFGTAMLLGKVETRTWDTKYRGKVLICTSQKGYDEKTTLSICGDEQYNKLLCDLHHHIAKLKHGDLPQTIDLNGFAIATGRLIGTRPMTPQDEEKTYVKYKPGLFCHTYDQIKPIVPFPWIGSLKWKSVSENQQKLIVELNNKEAIMR
jgi:hypothetical protein